MADENTDQPPTSNPGPPASGMPPGMPPQDSVSPEEKREVPNWKVNVLGVFLLILFIVTSYLMFSLWPRQEKRADGSDSTTWETDSRLFHFLLCQEKNDSISSDSTVTAQDSTTVDHKNESQPGNMENCWKLTLKAEQRILILVMLAGALGSFTHAANSFSSFVGNRRLKESWIWFYLLKAPIGMSLALIFYLVFRGGLINDSPIESLNIYGVLTLAALSGLFADDASTKLKEVFHALTKPKDEGKTDRLNQGNQVQGDSSTSG